MDAMKKRFLIKELKQHCKEKEITLLLGARQVGKTTLLKQLEVDLDGTVAFFSLEDKTYLNAFNEHPKNLFQFIRLPEKGEKIFVFIDEVQYLDDPSNFLKLLYDDYAPNIKLIVSGSSSFYIDKKFKDSLAGRKKIFHLPTMGFSEFLYFKEYKNWSDNVHTGFLPKLNTKELKALFSEYLIYGGYPKVVTTYPVKDKKDILKELATSYIKKDIKEASLHFPDIYLNILKVLATQTGGLLNMSSIGGSLKKEYNTIEQYLGVMEKSYHIGLISPFYHSAETELRKMKKAYFQDLGLRNFFAGNFDPVIIRDDRGVLLENYVYRLFADYYDTDWDIKYWRTQKKQEVDFIIQEKKAFEVKFSENLFKPYKYKYFKNKYPNIPLELLTYENILELNPIEKK